MKYYKKFLLVFLIICNMFVNSSCWNYKDVERLSIVRAFAIDKDIKNNEYILTVEVARPEAGENQGKYMSDIYESRGSTIFEAVRNIIKIGGKKTFWAHAGVGILSKTVASEDITAVMDFFSRDVSPRGSILIFISKEETAREILETGHKPEDLRTVRLEYVIENQESISKYPKAFIRDVFANISSKEKAMLLPMIDLEQQKGDTVIEVGGSAILKQDKVVGYLTEDETQYALWVMDELDGGLLVVQNIAGTNNNISFEIFKSKTKVKTDYKNDELRMKVDVNTTVAIGEVTGTIKFQEKEVRNKIKEAGEKELKDKLNYIIKKMQNEYKSDIFNFANKVEVENKKLWKTLKPKWQEEFVSVPVDINVDLIIRGSALFSTPLKE